MDSLVRACTRLERSRIDVPAGIQGGVLSFLVVVVSLLMGQQSYGIPLAIGVLFVAICDVPDANRIRLRSMLWATLWCAFATYLGGITASVPALHVFVAFALAAGCGFAIALGLRAGLIGTLSLVLFAVFAGAPISTGVAAIDASCVVFGGALTIFVTIATWPLRRFYGLRRAIARTYRLFAETTQRGGLELAAPVVAIEALNARAVIEHTGVVGESGRWFGGLLSDVERTRLAFIGLLSHRVSHHEYIEAVLAASSATSAAIAKSIMHPRSVTQAQAAVNELVRLRDRAPTSDIAVVVSELTVPLVDAVHRLQEPWPIGRRAQIEPVSGNAPSVLQRLRAHWSLTDGAVEHAIRLSIAFGVATLVSVIIAAEHTYWLPMTVAWVTKPDLAGTVNRIAMRVLGTVVGLLVFGGIAILTTNPYVLAAVAALAAYLLVAYIWANYPIAVVGVTIFVIALLQLSVGEPITDMVARLVATLAAGLWVLLISLFRPRRTGATVVSALNRTVGALSAYANAVRDDGDRVQARAEVLRERTAALAAVMVLGSEPRGFWERKGPRIEVDAGMQLMEQILETASLIVSEDLLRDHGMNSPGGWVAIDESLSGLERSMTALSH
jgi:uncharacterized membrane protein YccC